MARDRTRLALCMAFAGLSAAGFLLFSERTSGMGFPLDDAWIHQTYARNLVKYGQWAFIPGHPSAGSTSPLWTLLSAMGYFLGVDPRAWSYLLGGVALGITAWVAGAWTRRNLLHRSWSGWGWACSVLVLVEWHMVWAALSGMETILLACLALIVLDAVDREQRKPFLIGALIGLGVWVRPDALTLVLPAALAIGLRRRSLPRGAGKDFAVVAAGIAVFLLPYLAFNFALSGALWPSTFYAKQAEYSILRSGSLALRFLRLLIPPAAGAGVVLLPGIILHAAALLRAREWWRLTPLVWAIAFLGLYAVRLPVDYQHGRYVMPVIPIMLGFGLAGYAGWAGMPALRRSHWVLTRAWGLSVAAVGAAFWLAGGQAYARDVGTIETEMVTSARWVAANTEPQALVAAHDIGALGYFAERPLLDLAGLVSPEVIPFLTDEPRLAAYLDERGADYLVTFPSTYPLLSGLGEVLFVTRGEFSPMQGGDNMVVYRWRTRRAFAPLAPCMIYCSQPTFGRATYGDDPTHHR